MSLPSYSDVFSICHDREVEEEIHPGDRVRTGPNAYPQFEVIAVSGDKAWVRNVVSGADSVTALSRCRAIPRPELALAAE